MMIVSDTENEKLELMTRVNKENHEESVTQEDEPLFKRKSNGTLLSANWAAVFLCGDMIGASSLSLSKALQETGFYTGIVIYITITGLSALFAYLLAKTYAAIRRPLKESLNCIHIRDPYPQLAQYTTGNKLRIFVIVCIVVSDFLGAAALILLPADMLVRSFGIRVVSSLSIKQNMRIWMMIGTAIIIPFTFNDRPKDNKFIATLALVSAFIGNLLIIIMYCMAFSILEKKQRIGPSNAFSDSRHTILAIGILLTTVDGFDILPTIQEDMRDSGEYKKVILRAYILFSIMTIPVMVGGYLLFHGHHHLSENIVIELVALGNDINGFTEYITYKVLAYTTLVLYVVHIKSSLVLQLNPTFQYFEKVFPCKEGLCWKRCLLRTVIVITILTYAEIAPDLLPILSFNGSLLYVSLGIAIPGLMYIRTFKYISAEKKLIIIAIILVFLAYLIANSYFNILILGYNVSHL